MKIQRLIVISGPAGIGKSSLIPKLMNNELNEIVERLGFENLKSFKCVDPSYDLHFLDPSEADRVVLHYDFIRKSSYDTDRIFQIIRQCPSISWLTLWAKPEILVRRIEDRRSRIGISTSSWGDFVSSLRKLTGLIAIDRKRKIYLNPSLLEYWYRKWFKAINFNPSDRHWVLDVNDLKNPVLMSRDNWLREGWTSPKY